MRPREQQAQPSLTHTHPVRRWPLSHRCFLDSQMCRDLICLLCRRGPPRPSAVGSQGLPQALGLTGGYEQSDLGLGAQHNTRVGLRTLDVTSVDLQERTGSLTAHLPAAHGDSLPCCTSPVCPVIRGVFITVPIRLLTPALDKKFPSKGTQAAGTGDFLAGQGGWSVHRPSCRGGLCLHMPGP